jgi:ferredoxin
VLILVLTEVDPSGATIEIEPFKTAITSKFTRAWPYLLYAGALLAIGLFSERAYCRFLCPLGGVLAFLDRLHLLNLLKRRPECGSPCHLCERSCPVRAIEKSGKIVTSECFQCLDCQVDIGQELEEGVGCLGQKACFQSDDWGWICHPSRLAVTHLNLKLSRLSWSTDRQPISFMSRSISARRFSSALSTPA